MGFDLSLDERLLAQVQGEPLCVILYSDAANIWAARSWRMAGPDAEKIGRKENEPSVGAADGRFVYGIRL